MDTNQFGIIVERAFASYVALSLIVSAPFTVIIAQAALAIREIAINSRKTYNSNDSEYNLTRWIGTALVYIGIFSFVFGIVLLLRMVE
jgi:hypothetical protein